MKPASRSNIFRSLLSLVLLACAVWIFFNRVYIVDQITVWRYQPSSTVRDIAGKSSMSGEGRFLFYASRPQVEAATSFNSHCRQHTEKTAILGCYVARQIFIYDITDERLNGIKEVTAAHEMLHAVYDRLSEHERQRINALIDEAMKTINDASLQARLSLYDKTEPGERYNELHSILGSEAQQLPVELEHHYEQYFTNRLSLTELFRRYERVFTELEQQQRDLVDQLNTLAASIDDRSRRYNQEVTSLVEDISSFNNRSSSGDFASSAQFSRERSALLNRQQQLSSERQQIEAMIRDYDSKKQALDSLNLQAESLQRSIDSTSLPNAPDIAQ